MLLLFLETSTLDVGNSSRVRALDSIEHDVLVDGNLHIPDRLARRTREMGDRAKFFICHVGYAQEFERDGEVDGEHQLDVAVDFGGVGAVEDELADYAKGD